MNGTSVTVISMSRCCVTNDEVEENEGYEARMNNQPLKAYGNDSRRTNCARRG